MRRSVNRNIVKKADIRSNGAVESSSTSPKKKNRRDLGQKQTGVTPPPENRVLFFTTTVDELDIMQSAAVRVQRRADVIAKPFQDCSIVNRLRRQTIIRCSLRRIPRKFDGFDRGGAVGGVPALISPKNRIPVFGRPSSAETRQHTSKSRSLFSLLSMMRECTGLGQAIPNGRPCSHIERA